MVENLPQEDTVLPAFSWLPVFARQLAIGDLQQMARFCSVDSSTVQRWIDGAQKPLGESLLKLQCFLHLRGLKVKEFMELPEPTQRLALCIACGIVTVEEVQEILGYKNRNGVFDLVLRNHNPLSDKARVLLRLVDDLNPQLEAFISAKAEEFSQFGAVKPYVAAEPPPAQSDEQSTSTVLVMVHMINALSELFEMVPLTDELIAQIGEEIPSRRLVALSARLDQLVEAQRS